MRSLVAPRSWSLKGSTFRGIPKDPRLLKWPKSSEKIGGGEKQQGQDTLSQFFFIYLFLPHPDVLFAAFLPSGKNDIYSKNKRHLKEVVYLKCKGVSAAFSIPAGPESCWRSVTRTTPLHFLHENLREFDRRKYEVVKTQPLHLFSPPSELICPHTHTHTHGGGRP